MPGAQGGWNVICDELFALALLAASVGLHA
jgi:hypothetical protein